MLRKRDFVVFAFMIGLIFLSNNITPVHAQPENFPIGLNITYVVAVDTPDLHNEYQYTFDFIRWIDQENLTVEYEVNQLSRVLPFHEIHMLGPDRPPLWMDVSSWSVSDTIEISGIGHPIISMEDYMVSGVDRCDTFRLESVVQANGRENATSFWYHAQLGLLIDYLRVDVDIPSNSLIMAYTDFIIDSNFDQFNLPTFTVPVPTQTTSTPSTTTSTTDTTTSTPSFPPPGQTTTSNPISTTTSADAPTVGLTEILGVGIIIEILIILELVRRRK